MPSIRLDVALSARETNISTTQPRLVTREQIRPNRRAFLRFDLDVSGSPFLIGEALVEHYEVDDLSATGEARALCVTWDRRTRQNVELRTPVVGSPIASVVPRKA